jgi:uncharacterized protein
MIPDINLLVYAYDEESVFHQQSKLWLETLFKEKRVIMLPWVVILGFVRITTSRKIFKNPLSMDLAFEIVGSWLERSNVSIAEPGIKFYSILTRLSKETNSVSELVTDVYLAALAIENQCELHSNDSDFSRFKGLKWINPLE